MLAEKAICYYKSGLSCSVCILAAAEDIYHIKAGNVKKAAGGISNGLGIGAICSIPVSCIMVLGLTCGDEVDLKRKRLAFLSEFKKAFGTFNCSELQRKGHSCEKIIEKACLILESLV